MTVGASGSPGSPVPDLDVVVVSWDGHGDRARAIVAALANEAGVRPLVIYSNAAHAQEQGAGQWVQVPNDHFFGAKFERALRLSDAPGGLLLVQADAHSDDWPAVLRRFRECLQLRPRLGLWAPAVDYTPWTPQRVDIRPAGPGLVHVAHTDGIVLGMHPAVLQRLRRLDYSANNFGWGIDWVAICHCYSQGLEVLRDDSLHIRHPHSRGYDTRQATRQWEAFLVQFDAAEANLFELIKRYTDSPPKRRSALSRWWHARRAARVTA